MVVIGIDPGTRCGWAVFEDGDLLASGVWDLSSRRHEGGGMRYLRARRLFVELLDSLRGEFAVAYEEVHRHEGTAAAHVYGGLVAIFASVCEERSIPYCGIPVGTIKKCATGKGNAGKPAMVAAAKERWPDHALVDDNEADARWCAVAMHEGLA